MIQKKRNPLVILIQRIYFKKPLNSVRISLLFLSTLIISSFLYLPIVKGDTITEHNLIIHPGSYNYTVVNIGFGETMKVEIDYFLSISSIAVFIVDQTGFEQFQNSGNIESSAFYISITGDTSFTFSASGEWYIVFSRVNDIIGFDMSIAITITIDKTPPMIGVVTLEEGQTIIGYTEPLSGTVAFFVEVRELYYTVTRLDVYIDSVFVETFHAPVSVEPGWLYIKIRIDTYLWNNGNHSITFVAFNDVGANSPPYSIYIEFRNSIFDNPFYISIITLAYMLLLFFVFAAIPSWTRRGINPDNITKYSYVTLASFLTGFSLFIMRYLIQFIDPSVYYGQIFTLVAYSLFGIMGHSGSLWMVSHLISRGLPQDNIPKEVLEMIPEITKKDWYGLSIDQLLSRSDILDKVRSNQRTGMSIIMGIGTAIILWILNTGLTQELVLGHYILTFSSLALVVSIIVGIVISFFRTDVRIGEFILGEDMLAENKPLSIYKLLLQKTIQNKSNILNNMRKMVGFGLIFFIVGGTTALLIPLFLEQTFGIGGVGNWIIALFPLGLIVLAFVRFSIYALNPVLNILIMNEKTDWSSGDVMFSFHTRILNQSKQSQFKKRIKKFFHQL